MEQFDVLVVGGGPAGSTVAAQCAARGLCVGLVEHKRFPRHKVCGDVINPHCWPVFERLGVAGLVRALPHQELSGATFTTQQGATLTIDHSGLWAVRRSLLDAVLLDHAKSCGVTVYEGEVAHDARPGWRVSTTHHEFTAPVLVGADGRHSLIAKQAGLACHHNSARGGAIALQAHFHAPAGTDDRVQLHLFPGGYCGIVRVDATQLNLCLVTDRAGAAHHGDCGQLFAQTAGRNPQFRALGLLPEPLGPLQSAHPLRTPPNRPCGDGAFLVGDALRAVEPFTGQGIFFALRTGELAAQAICEGTEFSTAVRRLYLQRGMTNELLRRLMYHESSAGVVVAVLRRFPALQHWLAGTVLSSGRPARSGRRAPRAPCGPAPID
jgi:flavin-dependent dehydrogenase